MVRVVRRVGIAIGSLVIAVLVLGLIGGIAGFIGLPAVDGGLFGLAAVALGAFIYRDIVRREPSSAPAAVDERVG